MSEIQSARPGEGDVVIRVSQAQQVSLAVAVILASAQTGEDDSALLDLVLRATEFTPALVEPDCTCNHRDELPDEDCPMHPEDAA